MSQKSSSFKIKFPLEIQVLIWKIIAWYAHQCMCDGIALKQKIAEFQTELLYFTTTSDTARENQQIFQKI